MNKQKEYLQQIKNICNYISAGGVRAAQQHRTPEVLPGAVVLVPGGGGGHAGSPAVQARPAAAAPAPLHHHHAAVGRSAVSITLPTLARLGYGIYVGCWQRAPPSTACCATVLFVSVMSGITAHNSNTFCTQQLQLRPSTMAQLDKDNISVFYSI